MIKQLPEERVVKWEAGDNGVLTLRSGPDGAGLRLVRTGDEKDQQIWLKCNQWEAVIGQLGEWLGL